MQKILHTGMSAQVRMTGTKVGDLVYLLAGLYEREIGIIYKFDSDDDPVVYHLTSNFRGTRAGTCRSPYHDFMCEGNQQKVGDLVKSKGNSLYFWNGIIGWYFELLRSSCYG